MPDIQKQKKTGSTQTSKRGKTALDRIKGIEFEEGGIKLLVYGQSGTGKTTFVGTFPGKTLWVVCSGGKHAGELRSLNTKEHRKRIKQLVVEESGDLREVLNAWEDLGYDNLVIDHLTGFEDLLLKEVVGLDEIPVQRSWGIASQQQYGEVATKEKEYMRAALDLPSNVIIICQERTFGGNEEGGDSESLKPTVGGAVMPSVARWLFPAVDYLVQTAKRPRMEMREIKVSNTKTKKSLVRVKGKIDYVLRTGPHDVYLTKFRLPKGEELPEVIVDPTYEKFMKLIEEKDL